MTKKVNGTEVTPQFVVIGMTEDQFNCVVAVLERIAVALEKRQAAPPPRQSIFEQVFGRKV